MVSIKGNSVEVKNNHGLQSTFNIIDVRTTTMAEKVKELLPGFKEFGRKGKLYESISFQRFRMNIR